MKFSNKIHNTVILLRIELYPYKKTFYREFSSYRKAREYMTNQLNSSLLYSYILSYQHKILGYVEEYFVKHGKIRFIGSKDSIKPMRMKHWNYGEKEL